MVELLTVIFIVVILAAVAVPILRSQIDAAKWAEGKSIAGSIATALHTYVAGCDTIGNWNETTLTARTLGFGPGDLKGGYFDTVHFQWILNYDGSNETFTVKVLRPPEISAPAFITLDESGNWGP